MPPILLQPAALADARAQRPGHALLLDAEPGALNVLAVGPPADLAAHPAAAGALRLDLPGRLLIPGLVNAHAHLDLTAIGPFPYDPDAGFHAWLETVTRKRETLAPDLAGSIADGVHRSVRGGVVAIGDIAGSDLALSVQSLRDSPLHGVAFVELFGLGERQSAALGRIASVADAFDPGARVRVGLQPHAPYSAGLALYGASALHARERGVPVSTHLAESAAERRLMTRGDGPMKDLLESFGLWTPEAAESFGGDASAIRRLADELPGARWVLAHVNDCDDEDLALLAASDATVAYCPRSTAYFRHDRDLGPHRFQDMLAAGVNVALGTDSIINLPPEEADRLSPLDDARFLHRTTGATDELLAMLTTNGARALSLDESLFLLEPGPLAGLVAVDLADAADDPWPRALESDAPPETLFPALPGETRPAVLRRAAGARA